MKVCARDDLWPSAELKPISLRLPTTYPTYPKAINGYLNICLCRRHCVKPSVTAHAALKHWNQSASCVYMKCVEGELNSTLITGTFRASSQGSLCLLTFSESRSCSTSAIRKQVSLENINRESTKRLPPAKCSLHLPFLAEAATLVPKLCEMGKIDFCFLLHRTAWGKKPNNKQTTSGRSRR